MKLYIVVAALATRREEVLIDQFFRPYRSKLKIGKNGWLVCGGGTAAALCREIERQLAGNCPVVVSRWNGDSAWAKGSETLVNWLPRRLASVSSY